MFAEVPGLGKQVLPAPSSRLWALGQPVTAASACPRIMVQPNSRLWSLHKILVIYITANTVWSPPGRPHLCLWMVKNKTCCLAWHGHTPVVPGSALCRRMWHSLACFGEFSSVEAEVYLPSIGTVIGKFINWELLSSSEYFSKYLQDGFQVCWRPDHAEVKPNI